ncbi:MAG: hypothetical protein WBO16_19565 [Gammaproteobacteria bacterium]
MKKLTIGGNHLTLYLLLGCALLAGILAIESYNLVQTHGEISLETTPASNRIERTNYTAPAIAAFSEITERPLFSEDRKPLAPSVKAAVAAPVFPLRLQLEGVAITPEAKIAVVRDLSNNKMLQLTAGMTHQGWELTSITNTVATFTRGEQSQELVLKKLK